MQLGIVDTKVIYLRTHSQSKATKSNVRKEEESVNSKLGMHYTTTRLGHQGTKSSIRTDPKDQIDSDLYGVEIKVKLNIKHREKAREMPAWLALGGHKVYPRLITIASSLSLSMLHLVGKFMQVMLMPETSRDAIAIAILMLALLS